MPYNQRNGFGLYWTTEKLGIQNMSRKIRHTICKDSMFDIDIKNAHSTLLSLVVSMMVSCFPRGVLDAILNLIESVSKGFPSYSCMT